MTASWVIERKRDGHELEPGELGAFLEAYLRQAVSEEQMAAFLMAVHFQGLSSAELDAFVSSILGSGETLEPDRPPLQRVGKHSTGGVGDKVSLVLAPLAAELGLRVPKMSGRGLGHTGGTIDKLEAIPGFRSDLSPSRAREALDRFGFVMLGQTAGVVPLDLRLYALRSVTGTTSSVPLIAASIMGKKLAEGLGGLVLDVKVGRGAFFAEEDRAMELARTMVGIGSRRGVDTVALMTAMDRPLGRSAGNALEVAEAVACLRGEGPADLEEVTTALVREMCAVRERLDGTSGRAPSIEEIRAVLYSGAPLERFARVVEFQGGDARVIHDPGRLPRAAVVLEGVCGEVRLRRRPGPARAGPWSGSARRWAKTQGRPGTTRGGVPVGRRRGSRRVGRRTPGSRARFRQRGWARGSGGLPSGVDPLQRASGDRAPPPRFPPGGCGGRRDGGMIASRR